MVKRVLIVCLWMTVIAAVNIAQAQGMDSSQSGSQSPGASSSMSSSSAQTHGRGMMAGQSMTQLEPLVGKTVLDSQQKEIGTIQDIIVDSHSQKAKYAVLGSGGLLGIGEDYHAVPWSALNIQSSQGTVQSVNIKTDADTVKNSPVVQLGATRTFDSQMQSQVDSYYQGKGMSQTDGMTDGMMNGKQTGQTNGLTDGMMNGMQTGQTNGLSEKQTNGVSGSSAESEAGDSFQPESQSKGSISSESGTLYESPSDSGTRPSGMTGTSTQDRQFNTAEPQRESIYQETNGTNGTYGNGVRSGQDESLSSDANQMNQTSPFGTDGTSGTSDKTSTQFRSGYAEGANRDTAATEGAGIYSQDGTDGQDVQSSTQFVFFTDLTGREVKSTNDEKIGQLQDLVVDARQGNIAFGLVSMDDGTVAVPWNAMQTRGQDTLVVNAEKEMLRSLAFKSDNKPNFDDPSYQQRVYQQFGQQSPTVYGYVSPGGAAMDLESEYTRQFDAQKTETISGEIQEVMKDPTQQQKMQQSQNQSAMSGQVSQHLKVKTDQGQTIDVHAAPEQFLRQRNMELKKGDKIQVTGSRAQIGGKDVLIASRISKDGKEVMLRSAQGQPMWSQTGQSGSQMPGQTGQGSQSQPGQSNGSGTSGSSGSTGSDSMNSMTEMGSSASGSSGASSPDTGTSGSAAGTNGTSDAMDGATNGKVSDQMMQFKADEQTSVSGTIQSTDTGTSGAGAMAAMNEAVLFKVQTDQGQTQTIYAGPRHYLQQENVTFSTGDKINVTGWKKTIGGQEVFIASKIEKDGKTLELRDDQGNPKWKKEGSSLYNGSQSQQKSTEGSPSSSSGSSNSTMTY